MLRPVFFASQLCLLFFLASTEAKKYAMDQHVTASDAMKVYYENKQIAEQHGRKLPVTPTINIPSHTGLDETCSNKLCYMFESALSCKTLGLGFKKTCAKYLLGAIFQCPAFPGPDEIYNAPSVCGNEIASLLQTLVGGDLFSVFNSYLTVDFEQNACQRRCFQDFQYRSNDFYYNCYTQMNDPSVQANYTVATQLQGFQFYRNQACAVNDAGTNCYATAMNLINPVTSDASSPSLLSKVTEELTNILTEEHSPLVAAQYFVEEDAKKAAAAAEAEKLKTETETKEIKTERQLKELAAEEEEDGEEELDLSGVSRRLQAGLNLLDPTCNYFGLTDTWNNITSQGTMDLNNFVLQSVCGQFTAFGCCGANIVSLIAQDQTNASDLKFFPPCMLHYVDSVCATASLTNFCNNGSIANTTTMEGSITLQKAGATFFPNIYDQTQFTTLQGYILFGFYSVPGLNAQLEPYALNPFKPLNVQIINFEYFNGTEVLTPVNGSMYYPPQGDYTGATSGTFTFQLVLQNINDTETANTLYDSILNPYFAGSLTQLFAVPVIAEQVLAPITANAEPNNLPNSASPSVAVASTPFALLLTTAAAVLLSSRSSK